MGDAVWEIFSDGSCRWALTEVEKCIGFGTRGAPEVVVPGFGRAGGWKGGLEVNVLDR